MTMHAIDTLATAEMLQEAGLDEKAAKAIVQVFDEAAVATLATKADLEKQSILLRGTIAKVETTLHGEINEVRGTIEKVETTLRGEINEVRADLSGKINTLGQSLRKDIANTRTEISNSKWQLVVAIGVLLGLFKGFDKFL